MPPVLLFLLFDVLLSQKNPNFELNYHAKYLYIYLLKMICEQFVAHFPWFRVFTFIYLFIHKATLNNIVFYSFLLSFGYFLNIFQHFVAFPVNLSYFPCKMLCTFHYKMSYFINYPSGVKKSLVLVPGTS